MDDTPGALPAQTPLRDPLTGLYQQDYLLQALSELLQQQRSEPIIASLALLQLENFYEIRRWVGKSEANLLLSDIANLLVKSLPSSVLLCRCQHYEFAALLLDDCSINARALINQVKQALQAAVSASIPPQLELKCGIGLASLSRAIPCAEVMFARARHDLSQVLYRQANGDDLLTIDAQTPTIVLPTLLSALRKQQLRLSFQALVSLQEDGLRHYEIRCSLPAIDNPVSAACLFETAVQNGLGEHIDRWVLTSAIELLQQQGNESLRLCVNLTQNSLVSASFCEWLNKRLAQQTRCASQLLCQISEIDILTTQHHMASFSSQLDQLGVGLCISHFGCTPDPFRYLNLLNATSVKLDVALLEKAAIDPHRLRALQSTIDRLQGIGLRVVAPLVEELSMLPLLWESKINFVQGFCMQPPQPVMNFSFMREQVLRARR